jgi:thiamine-monophosphate kinase
MTQKHISGKKELLSDIGEFGLIKTFRRRCKVSSPEVIKGIGDDSAAVNPGDGITLITSDMMLENVHFDLSFTTFYQLGFKLMTVNISDIFAMGGTPKYFLMNLGIPKSYIIGNIKELYSGVMKAAGKYGVSVIGGDTCVSLQGFLLSGTLLGEADRVVTRSGASPGDGIFVTGTLGDSAMGFSILKRLGRRGVKKLQTKKSGKAPAGSLKIKGKELSVQDVLNLANRHLMPEPEPIGKIRGITSMIDISDGLCMDLSHICDESRVGAVIYRDNIPVSRELTRVTYNLGKDPSACILHGGEDYVLLFTAMPEAKIKNAVRIGEIVRKGRFIVDGEGKKTPFRAEGYEHFK